MNAAFKTSLLLILLAAVFPSKPSAMAYPALDTASHWSIQDWGFSSGAGFYVQGAGKRVWTEPGRAQAKIAFYNLSVLGIRLDGRDYPLASPLYLGEMDGGFYLVKYASFSLEAGLVLTVVLYFHDNGEFESYAYLQGASVPAGSGWDLIMRIDYDLEQAGNNVVEFLWNPSSEGASVSPPQGPESEAADGRLVYQISESPSYWSASAHEISVTYPPLAGVLGRGIERAGFARIRQAARQPFGMVFWGDESNSVEATFKAFASNDGDLNPQADAGSVLQLTAEAGGRPRYAYAGRDQLLFLRLLVPPQGVARLHSKLFQRSGSRPLVVRVFQHPPEDMGGWTFNPDEVIRTTEAGHRNFRNALAELTGNEDLTIQTSANGLPFLPYEGYAWQGQDISQSALHSLMTSQRGAVSINPGSVRDWQIDLFLVNWTLQGEGDAWENMFDEGGADVNRIAREGAAVFWPKLAAGGQAFQRAQASLSALRGAGLALNMDPAWSNCPFAGYCWNDPSACGGVRCGPACPSGAEGCRYRAHTCHHECTDGSIMSYTDVNRNTIRFSRQVAPGSAFSEVDWYRLAPEAWVKPGRHGIGPVHGPEMPPFIPN